MYETKVSISCNYSEYLNLSQSIAGTKKQKLLIYVNLRFNIRHRSLVLGLIHLMSEI